MRACGDRRSGISVLWNSENAALEIMTVLYNISSNHYNSIIGMSGLIPIVVKEVIVKVTFIACSSACTPFILLCFIL